MQTEIMTQLTDLKQIFSLNRYFLTPFIYRGQSDSNWNLITSIERCIDKYELHPYTVGYSNNEKWMLDEFKRKSHLYSDYQIDFNDNFEWLSVMQHHGAPTRLLDFSYSFFIALYFAIIDSTTDACVWAVNRHILRDNLLRDCKLDYIRKQTLKDEINLKHIKLANSLLCINNNFTIPSTMIPIEAQQYNERLSKQQGLFLMPTNPNISYIDNLKSAYKINELNFTTVDIDDLIVFSNKNEFEVDIQIIKFIIPKDLHRELIGSLKEMNITSEILFPGIDGLAKSLIHTNLRS